jgi:hypothetical protein
LPRAGLHFGHKDHATMRRSWADYACYLLITLALVVNTTAVIHAIMTAPPAVH